MTDNEMMIKGSVMTITGQQVVTDNQSELENKTLIGSRVCNDADREVVIPGPLNQSLDYLNYNVDNFLSLESECYDSLLVNESQSYKLTQTTRNPVDSTGLSCDLLLVNKSNSLELNKNVEYFIDSGVSTTNPSSGYMTESARSISSDLEPTFEFDFEISQGCFLLYEHNRSYANHLILCPIHETNITYLSSGDFHYHRCGDQLFKSVGGKIELIYGLNGGARDKKSEAVLKNRKREKAKFDKEIANAIKSREIDERFSTMEKELTGMSISQISKKYNEKWKHPDIYKFKMVKGVPILSVRFNGDSRFTDIGSAIDVYPQVSSIDQLKLISENYGERMTDQKGSTVADALAKLQTKRDMEGFGKRDIEDERKRKVKEELFRAMDAMAEENIENNKILKARLDARAEMIKKSMAEEPNGQDQWDELETDLEAIIDADNDIDGDEEDEEVEEIDDSEEGEEDEIVQPDPQRIELEQIVPLVTLVLEPNEGVPVKRLGQPTRKFVLTKHKEGYTMGADDNKSQINERTFNILSRFGKFFKVGELANEFVDEVAAIPGENWKILHGFQQGNFTGAGHPKGWDGIWTTKTPIPINEGDFISSFHDMMTDMGFEHPFIEWWKDAGENAIGTIMDIKYMVSGVPDTQGELVIPQHVVDRIGAQGSFGPMADFPFEDLSERVLGAGRGDELNIGTDSPLVAVSNRFGDESVGAWYPGGFFLNYDTRSIVELFDEPNENYTKLFPLFTMFTQFNNSTRVPLVDDAGTRLGPIFTTAVPLYVLSGGNSYAYKYDTVLLAPGSIGGDSDLVFKPGYESLASVTPMNSFSQVSSANRSYTTTPYGDLAYLVYLAKTTNLYVAKGVVNMFLPMLRCLKFACMCEIGSQDIYRGAWVRTSDTKHYIGEVLTPCITSVNSTIRFVKLAYYVTNNGTATMQNITRIMSGPGGRIAFLGNTGSTSNSVVDETFILQLLMSGAHPPDFGWLGTTKSTDGTAQDPTIFTDVAALFKEPTTVNIICFIGESAEFVAGGNDYDSIDALEIMEAITVADIEYNVSDLIGTFVENTSYQYWYNQIYNMAITMGCTDYFEQALFFFIHNMSVCSIPRSVSGFSRFTDGGVSVGAPTAPVYVNIPEVELSVIDEDWIQFCSGVASAYAVEDSAEWELAEGDTTIRVPKESGLEYLVIFGICLPAQKTGVSKSYDYIDTWSARYWAPEYMMQAFSEVNRKYFFTSKLYEQNHVTSVPNEVLNLYNKNVGMNSPSMPAGLIDVHDYYMKICSMNVDIEMISATMGWVMRHNHEDPITYNIIPYVRPEFLTSVSGYSSTTTTVWGPQDYAPLRTPKMQKVLNGKMNNNKIGVFYYELSARVASSINFNLDIDDTLVEMSYAALNLNEHYISTSTNVARSSKRITTTIQQIGKYGTPALRPIDKYTYVGVLMPMYRLCIYDTSVLSAVCVRNATNTNTITTSPIAFTYMNVLSDGASKIPPGSDPDGAYTVQNNLSTLSSLFSKSSIEPSSAGGTVSRQEKSMIMKQDGVVISSGGPPASDSI